MAKYVKKIEVQAKKGLDEGCDELSKIKEGLRANPSKLLDNVKQRVAAGDWKIESMDCPTDNGKSSIDIVLSAPDGKKQKFVIIDISVPHLGIGQKYMLPTKAKTFQIEHEVAAAKIKKVILLIHKGTESVNTMPSRIRCPIIEMAMESIVKKAKPVIKSDKLDKPRQTASTVVSTTHTSERDGSRHKGNIATNTVSGELLSALKEAVVYECLSTMYKRNNKYVCKGLWRWIEREIMDPSVHFYLIILLSIYQGKTGEILSKTFKTADVYSSKSDDVISAVFSRENSLADEIKRQSERHRKALKKFLACFSQTPPYEYLKSIFLKEFRTHGDSLKARMTVFTTLLQLLERCGFEGEKETRYPLEILDELKIFQSIMTGNYTSLRVVNAGKKLKNLVPQIEWTEDEIYMLRDQLAKGLNLPPMEFNLNAFLPQAFYHDARRMSENRKEAMRNVQNRKEHRNADSRGLERSSTEDQLSRSQKEYRPNRPGTREAPREQLLKRDYPSVRQHSNRVNEISEADSQRQHTSQESLISTKNIEMPRETREPSRELPVQRRYTEYDEANHRHFENFGGNFEEDQETIKLALSMLRYESEKKSDSVKKKADVTKIELELEQEAADAFNKQPRKNNWRNRKDADKITDDIIPPKRSANGKNADNTGTGMSKDSNTNSFRRGSNSNYRKDNKRRSPNSSNQRNTNRRNYNQ